MAAPSNLVIGAVFAFLAAAVYLYVGRLVARRQVQGEARLAWQMFALWWYGLGATTLVGGVLTVAAASGRADLNLFLALTMMNLLIICAALLGLLYYLLYLFTGRYDLWRPLVGFYVAYFALLVYFVIASQPVGIKVTGWTAALDYAAPIRGAFFTAILALLVFPQIIGALAYFSLVRRLSEPTQRYRVALVSWSIIVWFLSTFLASATGLSDADWWQAASRLLGLGAAVTVVLAYQPPAFVQRRWGIQPLAEAPA